MTLFIEISREGPQRFDDSRYIVASPSLGIIRDVSLNIDHEKWIMTVVSKDVTLDGQHHNMKNPNFLGDVWDSILNAKIPDLFTLSSAAVFKHCIPKPETCKIVFQDNRDKSLFSYQTISEQVGNYSRIMWLMIAFVLKDLRVIKKRNLLGPKTCFVSSLLSDQSFSEGDVNNEFLTKYTCTFKTCEEHLKNVSKLELPLSIKRYLDVPTNKHFTWIMKNNLPDIITP